MTGFMLQRIRERKRRGLIKGAETVGDGDALGLALDEITKQSRMLGRPVAILPHLEAVDVDVFRLGVVVGEDTARDLGHTAFL